MKVLAIPIRVNPAESAPKTIHQRSREVLQSTSKARPSVCAPFPLRPLDNSHERERYADDKTNGTPEIPRARSRRMRESGLHCSFVQLGEQALNSSSLKYLSWTENFSIIFSGFRCPQIGLSYTFRSLISNSRNTDKPRNRISDIRSAVYIRFDGLSRN